MKNRSFWERVPGEWFRSGIPGMGSSGWIGPFRADCPGRIGRFGKTES